MFGCLGRIGCLIILAVLLVAGYFTRNVWQPTVMDVLGRGAPTETWEPLTDAGATRTRAALDDLAKPSGPVFKTLSGADVASYVFDELARQLPRSTDSVQAAVIGDQIRLRAVVRPSEVGGAAALGAIGGLLGERERVELAGRIRVISPGLAEFDVATVRVGKVGLPQSAIPRALRAIFKGARPAGVSPKGVPLKIPKSIGDVRIANGKITVYRAQ